jgi:sec-independent protein translocase protein TatA
MFDIGGGELMLILIAVLIFFGPKKLPELAQSLGRGIREFKRAQREFTDHINQAIDQEHQRSTRTVSRPMPRPVDVDAAPPAIAAPAPDAGTAVPPMETASVETRADAPGSNGLQAEPRDQG